MKRAKKFLLTRIPLPGEATAKLHPACSSARAIAGRATFEKSFGGNSHACRRCAVPSEAWRPEVASRMRFKRMSQQSQSNPRVVIHGREAGAITTADIDRRAQEIADIRGHGEKFTKEDVEQARRELFGTDVTEPRDDPAHPELSITRDPSDPVAVRGEQHTDMNEPDENENPARLAQQGVNEATHDQMVAASRDQRNRERR